MSFPSSKVVDFKLKISAALEVVAAKARHSAANADINSRRLVRIVVFLCAIHPR
jgi:hypothetical protein